MYSYENRIVEIYSKIDKLGKRSKCKNDLKYEKELKKDLYRLLKGKYISEIEFEELLEKCDKAKLGDEARGFFIGIYFMLKLEKERGEDIMRFVKHFGIVEGY